MNILELPMEIVSDILALYVADSFQSLGKKNEEGGNSPGEVMEAVRRLELVCKPFYAIVYQQFVFFELAGVRLKYIDAKLALCLLCTSFSQEGDRRRKLCFAVEQMRYPEDHKKNIVHDVQQISEAIASICSPAFISARVTLAGPHAVNAPYIAGPIMGIFLVLTPRASFMRRPPSVSPQELSDPLTRRDVQILFRALCRYLLRLRERLSDKIDGPVEELHATVSTIRPGNH